MSETDKSDKLILDACCGSRMFWFNREHENTVFMDNRTLNTTLCDGRNLEIAPDVIADFTDMPFDSCSFKLVVFDPPHLKCGANSWTAKKYGRLESNWKDMIRDGFNECFRVLEPGGILVFKWNEYQIPVKDILALTNEQPLFGNRSGKQAKTHWILFMKKVSDD